ncbi:MAG: hypothetical protein IJ067_07805 [Prevotella sp.]|nr:hypothetical protein [Prevotella sp.]
MKRQFFIYPTTLGDRLSRMMLSWMMILALVLSGSTTFVSCSSNNNPIEVVTPPQVEARYLTAADLRENVSAEENALTYAPYKEWRADALEAGESLFNLRFTTNEFDATTENSQELPDPSYVPTRQGLDGLNISGSARPTKKQLEDLAVTLKQKAGNMPVYLVDLRSETHAIINGHHLSQYGFQNWVNIGKSKNEIVEQEKQLVNSLKGGKITYAKIGSSTNYEPKNVTEVEVSEALTEEELVTSLGMRYQRITALDHVFQKDAIVDDFLEFYRSLPADGAWLHFHCQAGRGRTTFFMCLYDMLRNPDVPLKDIIYRQTLIGGTSMLNDGTGQAEWRQDLFKEISVMIPVIYAYVQENVKNGYSVPWSTWKKQKYNL